MQVKANSVKQEYEKQDELKRSAMRAVAALLAIPGADRHPQLGEFITQIRYRDRQVSTAGGVHHTDQVQGADRYPQLGEFITQIR